MHTQCSMFNVHINGKKGQLPVFKQSNIWNSCGRWILLFANAPGLFLVRDIHLFIIIVILIIMETLPSSSSSSSLENHHHHVTQSPLSWSWMEDLAPPAVTVNPQLLKGWNQSLKERTHSILYSAHCITHIVRGVKPMIGAHEHAE